MMPTPSWLTGLENYPSLYAAYQEMQVSASSEPEVTTIVAQPLDVDAKEFKEDFVQNRLNIERAHAVTAIVVSVVVLIVLIALAVHGASNCQYETYQAFCNNCERVHDMTRCLTPGMAALAGFSAAATILPGVAGTVSSLWLGITFVRNHTKESMEEWFAVMSNKRSLRAIYEQFYNQCLPFVDDGIAPAVKESVLTIAEGEELSSLMKQYSEFSDKECPSAKWLESEWVAFLYAPSAPPAIDVDPMVLGMHYLEQMPTANGTDNPSVDSLETFLDQN